MKRRIAHAGGLTFLRTCHTTNVETNGSGREKREEQGSKPAGGKKRQAKTSTDQREEREFFANLEKTALGTNH